MVRNHLVIIFLTLFCNLSKGQTSIGGIINDYAKIQAYENVACQAILSVEEATDFAVGGKVLIIQMQGASIDESNSISFGSITDLGQAGKYEFNVISSITENQITLDFPLVNPYEVSGKLQIISVPVYNEAIEIVEILLPQPWNGETGGVLALEVNNTLKLSANIQANDLGFRGGVAATVSGNDCTWLNEQDDYFYGPDDWRGSAKGESIAILSNEKRNGKGATANGGGGGNDHNAGGGGGALLSAGGPGGENNEPSFFGCDGSHPGVGGKSISDDSDRLFMGGGGGAGHENNEVGTDGGNGGGIIIIKADSLVTQGFSISSNGATPVDGGGDGAGGGGAAGTIVLLSEFVSEDLMVSANGGNGGLIDNNNGERCHGPGGGGSGGMIKINFPVIPSFNLQTLGGTAGLSIQSSTCTESSNGAEAGEQGFVEGLVGLIHSADNITLPISDFSFSSLTNNSIQFTSNAINYEFLIWDFAGLGTSQEEAPDFTFDEPGSYEVSLIAGSACGADTLFQTLIIEEENPLSVAFVFDDGNGCAPHLVQFTNQSTGDFENILWTFEGGTPETSTDPNPIVLYDTPGVYDVQLQLDANAVLNQSELITVLPAVEAIFGYNMEDNTVEFINVSTNATAYQWDFGDGSPNSFEENPVHTYTAPGTYNVTLVATSPFCGKAITESIFVDFPSSTEEEKELDIQIFPNPTKDFLTIIAPELEDYSLMLRTLTGTRLTPLMQRSALQTRVDLSKLAPGVYLLTLLSSEQEATFKILKFN